MRTGKEQDDDEEAEMCGDINRLIVPFLACGDLSGYDADQSYPLDEIVGGAARGLAPVQGPINPQYKAAMDLKKDQSNDGRKAGEAEAAAKRAKSGGGGGGESKDA